MKKDFEFLLHMQRLMFEAEALATQFGVKDRFLSIMMAGLLPEEDDSSIDKTKFQAIYSYNIDDIEELDEIQEFIYHTYYMQEKDELNQNDLNNLLGDNMIDLED
tara:strand:- start:14809 stop:15123 length:315 start_codon:yes stop_codon:yes gene_type:complete